MRWFHVEPTGIPEPFFTFKTTFVGSVSFSITKSGIPATWYMGDGTIYAGSNSVTHEYLVPGEKTVSVSMGDSFDTVSDINGIVNTNTFKAVTEFNMSNLVSLSSASLSITRQPINLLLCPENLTGTLLLDGQNQAGLFGSITTCLYTAINNLNTLIVRRMGPNAIIDISGINTQSRIDVGDVSITGTNAKRIIFPVSNSNNHISFTVINVPDQGDTDLSGYTGTIDVLNLTGIRQMTELIMPNLSGTNNLRIIACRELTAPVVLNNGAGNCSVLRFDQNGNTAIFDLTNFNFSGNFVCFPFSVNAARQIIFPVVNSNNFTNWSVAGLFNQGNTDLSGFTGDFSGVFALSGWGSSNQIILPPNIQNVSNFSIAAMTLTQPLTIDNGAGTITTFLINRVGNNCVVDISNCNISNSLRFIGFGLAGSCKEIIFPVSNANNFILFQIEQLINQGTLDLSVFSGVFTGTFRIVAVSLASPVVLPTGDLTGLATFEILSTEINQFFAVGTDIIATNISFNNCLIDQANIDAMIDAIDVNVANFPSDAKTVNFGNANTTRNQTPSAGKITLMQSIATSNNFTFTYWNGSINVIITP